jgi:hypothetical protein
MTALKKYKRTPSPTLATREGQGGTEALVKHLADELQQIENTLTVHGQATTSIEDGVTTITQTIIDLTSTTGDNTAAILQEATVRSSEDSAMASLVTNLTATVTAGDNTNAAAITHEMTTRADEDSAMASLITSLGATVTSGDQTNATAITQEITARSDEDSAISKVVSTQRALFGAASGNTWESTKQYTGSTSTIAGQTVATGDDVVFNAYIYRCKLTHTNQQPPSTSYWDTVDTVDAKVTAAVAVESTARSSANTAQASINSAVSARVTVTEDGYSQNAADILTSQTAISTNKTSQSQRNDTVAARFGVTVADNYDNAFSYAVGDEVVYSSNVYRCIQAATGTLPTNSSYWTLQELLQGLTDARIVTLEDTYADRTTALSSKITTVSAKAEDAHTKYGVKLNSNGYITGFEQNNNGTTGTFKILADEFKIIDPAASAGSAGVEVFAVSGGYATIKNIRSAASGARLQIEGDTLTVHDANVPRVILGNLN